MTGVINKPINCSRLRYNRVDLPHTYRNLVEAEFVDDYTMGYTHEIGFRASTCTPFYFYDINLEVQQPIRIHSFAFHDYGFVNSDNDVAIMSEVRNICDEVKAVNGEFVSVFSNELLGGEEKIDWKKFYETVLKQCHV
ncbi:hypothetical protein ACU8V7_07355 [Zobellia nedashkovskayae]